LQSAYEQVVSKGGCAGVDEQTVAHFARTAGRSLKEIVAEVNRTMRGW
jgi:hypothetical protein